METNKQSYEKIALQYAQKISTKPENAYYEMPATLSLLPTVKGKSVLDAGCGPGQYVDWLLKHGANVTAFDASPRMIQMAKKRIGNRAKLLVADLEKPLPFADSSFDLIICSLVLDNVKNLKLAYSEFRRVLKNNGALVFSKMHPFADYYKRMDNMNYFQEKLIEETWQSFGQKVLMRTYHRPLGMIFSYLVDACFEVQKIIEPRPTKEFQKVNPKGYQTLNTRPGFICFLAKASSSAIIKI